VWSAPTNEELADVNLVANQMMLDVLEGPSEKFQERAQAIQAELQAVLRDLAKPGTQTGRGRARRNRSPSVEMVESDAKATGKTVGKSRQTKRAQKEDGAQRPRGAR
jgi:predicted phosphoribosyltransferase